MRLTLAQVHSLQMSNEVVNLSLKLMSWLVLPHAYKIITL